MEEEMGDWADGKWERERDYFKLTASLAEYFFLPFILT
jgi:hypothetical protein